MARGRLRWFHVTLNTLNSWLPGDERGFRSRDHRIHSSGDHRHPPLPGEHAGLHRYAQGISGEPVRIPRALRPIIGRRIVADLQRDRWRVVAVSVASLHVHVLVELPDGEVRTLMGEYKRSASCAVTGERPGHLWSAGCGVEPVDSDQHHRHAQGYIRDHIHEGHWWTAEEAELLFEVEG